MKNIPLFLKFIVLLMFFFSIPFLLLSPIPTNQNIPAIVDFLHHLSAIEQARIALQQHQFPLRLALTASKGISLPIFQFYSSTSYTIAGLVYTWISPHSVLLTYKLMILAALMLGGFYIYRLMFWLTQNNLAALFSVLVYLLTPYMMILIDHLGAFNETIALGIVPIVLYYTVKQFYSPNYFFAFATSISWYALITIHLLTFFATSGCIFLLLLLLAHRIHYWKNLFIVLSCYLFTLLLACWFIAPIVNYSNILGIARSFDSTFFTANLPTLSSLISLKAQFYNGLPSINDSINSISNIHPAVGLSSLLAFIINIFFFFKFTAATRKLTQDWVIVLLILFILIFLLIWSPINFWQWLPSFGRVFQYSWRLLGQLSWIGALLFGFAIQQISTTKMSYKKILLVTILIGSIPTSLTWLFAYEESRPLNMFMKYRHVMGDYAIDAMQHPNQVQLIDNLIIFPNNQSQSTDLHNLQAVFFPSTLLRYAYHPTITLQGEVKNREQHSRTITILINGKYNKSFQLNPGEFKETFVLNDIRKLLNAERIRLDFIVENRIGKKGEDAISIKNITLGGLLNSTKILDLTQVIPYCYHQKDSTLCQLNVPKNVRLVELPFFYYPTLLKVTLNGKSVPYVNVLYQNQLLTAIATQPGKMNNIKIQFTGLRWANFISNTAWQIFIVFFIYALLKLKRSFAQVKIDEAPDFRL